METPDKTAVIEYLQGLQEQICSALEKEEGNEKFLLDAWQPEPGSEEAELYEKYLKPRDWVTAAR